MINTRDLLKAEIAATLNDPTFRSRLADYRGMRQRAADDGSRVSAPFSRERLDADRAKLDAIAGELLGLVNEPLSELAVQAQTIATVEQLGQARCHGRATRRGWIDRGIKIGLTAIGCCLLLGLFTPVGGGRRRRSARDVLFRIAAVAGAARRYARADITCTSIAT